MSNAKPKLTIVVSSTVYGIEELLERVYTLFVGAQFFRYQEVEQFIKDNFANGKPIPPKRGES
jgi:hypothetical protein